MSPIRTVVEALNEDCPTYLLAAAWCYFIVGVMIEYMLPIFFGNMMSYPLEVAVTEPFIISAKCLYLMDKMMMLLGLFCIGSTYTKVAGWRRDDRTDTT